MTDFSKIFVPGKRLSRADIEAVLNSPEARRGDEANPRIQRAKALYAEAAEGVLRDLASAGFAVASVGRLQNLDGKYLDAVPILLDWLPRVRYLALAEDIVSTLRMKQKTARKQIIPVLVDLFRDPPHVEDPMLPKTSGPANEHLREAIASSLGDLADPIFANELIELAADRSYGDKRSLLVLGLPKVKDERVPGVLLDLLDDPSVAPFAIQALGKLKYGPAAERLEGMLDSPDENVRDQAKNALKKLRS